MGLLTFSLFNCEEMKNISETFLENLIFSTARQPKKGRYRCLGAPLSWLTLCAFNRNKCFSMKHRVASFLSYKSFRFLNNKSFNFSVTNLSIFSVTNFSISQSQIFQFLSYTSFNITSGSNIISIFCNHFPACGATSFNISQTRENTQTW